MPNDICPKCGVEPRVTGRSYCVKCGREWQNNYKKTHPQNFTEAQKERTRQRARERIARMTPEKRQAYYDHKAVVQQAWLKKNPEIRLRRNAGVVETRKGWSPERLARQKQTQREHYLRTRARSDAGKCGYSPNCHEPKIGNYKYCLLHWCTSVFFAHTKRVTPNYTPTDLVALWQRQEGKCPVTGLVLIPGETAALDHIVPIDRNGDGTIGNVRFVHTAVNRIKWNRTDLEFKNFICNFLPLMMPWGQNPN